MENRGNREIFIHRVQRSQRGKAATESGLARRTRRLTQIRNKNSSSASICVFCGQRPFFPYSKNPDGRNVWQRPGNMDSCLATLDQPPAKSFADETGVVELLH